MQSLLVLPQHRVLLPGQRRKLVAVEEAFLEALGERLRFGVVLQQAVGPLGHHAVGTEARVTGRRRAPGASLRLSIVGERRFRIGGPLGFGNARAPVEFLDEPVGAGDAAPLLEQVRLRLQRYMALSAESGEGGNVHLRLARDPVRASYQVASLLRVSAPEHQELLEVSTAVERLAREERMLTREADLLRHVLGLGRMGRA